MAALAIADRVVAFCPGYCEPTSRLVNLSIESLSKSFGVLATANSFSDKGIVVSSRVRMEIMQEINCSNSDVYPLSYNSNMAAFGYDLTAFSIRFSMFGMSNDFFIQS